MSVSVIPHLEPRETICNTENLMHRREYSIKYYKEEDRRYFQYQVTPSNQVGAIQIIFLKTKLLYITMFIG